MDNNKNMTNEEREEIRKKSENSLCTCNHPKKEHNRFIDGLFKGCSHPDCKCNQFEWDY